MPGMDGLELLREIRALAPDAGGSVPVIAMTAFGTHADCERLLHTGFEGCLLKPFTPDKLVETILSVLNSAHLDLSFRLLSRVVGNSFCRLSDSTYCTG